MKIKSVPEDYTLITNSQDIQEYLKHVGFNDNNISEHTSFDSLMDCTFVIILYVI